MTGHAIESLSERRATIRDVAALASVSHQTVSRVINGQTSVAEPTRLRVLEAIAQLGYVPSPLARGLISNRTHTLGMVTADVSDGFFARAVAGAEAEARRRNYYLIVGSVEESPDDQEDTGYLRLMLDRRVEGLILARPGVVVAGEQLERANRASIPLLSIGSSQPHGFTVVDVDNRRGGRDATDHLIQLGHRAIATIVGPLEWPSAEARRAGYDDALRAAGIPADPALVETVPDWGLESGYAATERLLARRRRISAIFAHSDLIAIGAIRRLRSEGLRVPEDVSVIGYDDLPVAGYVDPPLTTVHQPMREVGELAAGILLDRVAGLDHERGPHLLPASLVVRQSTAHLRT
ncbi:MAG TPA: LacI family DNA-binding transcriptional regulator [Gaiellaceae bacterium]